MSKYKHVIHSEKFLAELLKDEAAKKRYEEDYEKLLVAYYVVKMRKAGKSSQARVCSRILRDLDQIFAPAFQRRIARIWSA